MSWGRFNGKFGAKRVKHAGYSFASKLEAATFDLLELERKLGLFTEIQVQDRVKLTAAEIVYIADFKCTRPDGSFIWVEAKGFETPEWKLKLRLWRFYGPGPLLIYKGSHMKPRLVESVIPVSSI